MTSLVGLTYGHAPGVDGKWHRNTAESIAGRFNAQFLATNPFATIPSNLHEGSITFRALFSATVGLQDFDFVGRPNTGSFNSGFTITDLAGLFRTITQTVTDGVTAERRTFTLSGLDLASTVNIELGFGADASTLG